MAEYDNYRRRTQKERENVYPDAVANTLKELLPLLDNLQRALDTPCADENYLTGIKMIQTGFEEYLKKMGVETFGKAGEPFDPNLHNAVMHIEDESHRQKCGGAGVPKRLPPRRPHPAARHGAAGQLN